MNRLHNQMATWRQDIALVARERINAVRAIKADTASSLQAYGQERSAMATALRADLHAERVNRTADVLEIRDNANQFSQNFRQDHADMGAALRQSLLASRDSVVNAVESLCIEFTQERQQFAKAHRAMASAQGKALAKDRQDRSGAVTAMMQSFNKAHRQMAAIQTGSLTQARQQRSQALLELMRSFHPALHNYQRAAVPVSVGAFSWPVGALTDAAAVLALPHEPVLSMTSDVQAAPEIQMQAASETQQDAQQPHEAEGNEAEGNEAEGNEASHHLHHKLGKGKKK